MVSADGKRPRVEDEAAPGDTTDTIEDVDPEVKRRVTDALVAPVQALPQVPGGIQNSPFLLSPQETSFALCGGSWPGSVNQSDEDMSELVPVLLPRGKKRYLDLKDPPLADKGRQTTRG